MTQRDIDLNVEVSPLAEDVFYIKKAMLGEISQEAGEKRLAKVRGRYTEQEYREAIKTANRLIENIEKYGVPCKQWS